MIIFAQESIDIYSKDVGKFLEFNLAEHRKKAWESYQKEDFEAAAEYYLLLLQHDLSDNNSIYNLACFYGLLGKAELAAEFFGKAFKAGFKDVDHIKNDPDFEKMKDAEIFQKVLKLITKLAEKEKPNIQYRTRNFQYSSI